MGAYFAASCNWRQPFVTNFAATCEECVPVNSYPVVIYIIFHKKNLHPEIQILLAFAKNFRPWVEILLLSAGIYTLEPPKSCWHFEGSRYT